ncbi:MAG: hypothetical protein NWF14_08855 [Candidatus Bathyarchaeota archaeon]|nr:hypothetical protein [Candidatus Bathyarchaeota archaeon]
MMDLRVKKSTVGWWLRLKYKDEGNGAHVMWLDRKTEGIVGCGLAEDKYLYNGKFFSRKRSRRYEEEIALKALQGE